MSLGKYISLYFTLFKHIFSRFLCFWARKSAEEKFWVEGLRTTFNNPSKPRLTGGQNPRPVSSLNCVIYEGLTEVFTSLLSCTFLSTAASLLPLLLWEVEGSLHSIVSYLSQRQREFRSWEIHHADFKYGGEGKTTH